MQAESTHDLAQSKVELLRLSLGQRLTEIPKTSSFNKMDILREEFDRTSIAVQSRDSVVAKMAALSGKLNLRFDAVNCLFCCWLYNCAISVLQHGHLWCHPFAIF